MIGHAGIATKKVNVGAQRKSFCRSHNTIESPTIPIRSSLFSVTFVALWFNSPEISPQTCPDAVLDRLEKVKRFACNGIKDCKKTDSSDVLWSEYSVAQVCVDARTMIQRVCFKGSPDRGHEEQIEEYKKKAEGCYRLLVEQYERYQDGWEELARLLRQV